MFLGRHYLFSGGFSERAVFFSVVLQLVFVVSRGEKTGVVAFFIGFAVVCSWGAVRRACSVVVFFDFWSVFRWFFGARGFFFLRFMDMTSVHCTTSSVLPVYIVVYRLLKFIFDSSTYYFTSASVHRLVYVY